MSNNAAADTVAFDVQDGIAWVRFNRPEKRNCMSPRLNRRNAARPRRVGVS